MLAAGCRVGRSRGWFCLSEKVPLRFSCLRLDWGRSISELLSSDLTKPEDDVTTSAAWTIVQRPILETLLTSYAQHPTVAQPLFLHGPRGVGKRTVIEGLMGKWNKFPHVSAFIDLHIDQGYSPPWTMHGELKAHQEDFGGDVDYHRVTKSCPNLGGIRTRLELALESLAKNAIEMGYAESDDVLGTLLERHAIDGALGHFLHRDGATDIIRSKTTTEMWKKAIQHVRSMDTVSSKLPSDTLDPPGNICLTPASQPRSQHEKPLSVSKRKAKEDGLSALLVAKHLMKIQEGWRLSAGMHLKSKGVITTASPDSATSWAVFLLELLSLTVQEARFQNSQSWSYTI